MNSEDPKLEEIAKKHKKLFETFSINPGGYIINENEFFFVIYERRKINGYAVISPQAPDEIVDYKEALEWLLKYARFSSSLLKHAGFRADISMFSFEEVYSFLKEVTEKVNFDEIELFLDCKYLVEFILDKQKELVDKYNRFYAEQEKVHDGTIEHFTQKDTLDLLEFMGEFEYIQYKQLYTQYQTIDKFKQVFEISKSNPEIKSYSNRDIQVYLSEFSTGKAEFHKELQEITYQENMHLLTKEEFIKVVKRVALETTEKVKRKTLKKLRYPKF
ncbi:hypothetical protein [Lentibacillus amyloliquefaciens]|uniref:Uncharacterized protein n=1 Tax=Lentibacillus amyloliquefaciens TaxID=1472767 RepID=A0A0U4DPF5_9BACI|nr:hypothetical protein [Lentibacillus amyloliquefaciens]ALX47192.1 hypothetical protein AOX59_00405 [Lentibacillus amyloliquefaciens]